MQPGTTDERFCNDRNFIPVALTPGSARTGECGTRAKNSGISIVA